MINAAQGLGINKLPSVIGVAIIALLSAFLFQLPAFAGQVDVQIPVKPVQDYQLAQVRICAPPKQIINGRCRLPNFRPAVCRAPRVLINGRCKLPVIRPAVCRAPRVLINGRCKLPVIRPAVCRAPRVIINGRCKLPVIRPAVCRAPRVLINGRCKLPVIRPAVCRAPKVLINGRCKLPVIRPAVCQLPNVLIGGVCRRPNIDACERGRVWRNGRCVRPNPVCRSPRVRSPYTGRCYLPFDIVPIPEAQCRAPWYYSARAGGCVKPRPRQRPKENILWIQSCLNQLGYRAGTEDGLAGRKTRNAWDSFRRGIGDRGFAEFTDPRTLAQLYRQCAPGQDPAPSPPAEDDLPPIRGELLPPLQSDGLSYRPAMCATGSLYTLLNKTYGDAVTLEKCGRSCLPVPDGMALSEVRRLETESGVNWCKSCTKIGDEGILCPLPNKP